MNPIQTFIAAVQTNILDPLITLIALGAFLYFVWGVVLFVQNAENEEKRKQGQQHIIWGLVGLVILFGAKAIIALIASSIGVSVPR